MSTIRATYVQHGSSPVPNITLDGSGNVTVASGLTFNSSLSIPSGSVGTPGLSFASDTDTGFYSATPNTIAIATSGTAAVTVDASQRVGIGNSSPSAALDVTGNLKTSTLQIGTNPAGVSIGVLGIPNQKRIYGRNAANSADVNIAYINGSDGMVFGPGDAAVIDSSGRVGIGTTSPARTLHVAGSAVFADTVDTTVWAQFSTGVGGIGTNNNYPFAFATNGTERARIDTSGRLLVGTSSGSLSYSSVVVRGNPAASGVQGTLELSRASLPSTNGAGIGTIAFTDSSSNLGATIAAIAEGSWTSGSNHRSRLEFSTTADGASSPTERIRIKKTGEVAHFADDSCVIARSARGAGTTYELFFGAHSATNVDNGTGAFVVYTNGAYATLSDQTQKKNIVTTRDGYLDDLNKLRVVKYNWNEQQDDEPKELGLIAQEVEQVFPGLISEMRSEEGEQPKKGVKAGVLPYMLIKALQEATARIETLEAEVAALKAQ